MQVHPDVNTSFIGYDQLSASVQIIKHRKVSQKGKVFYQLVLDQTPFYAEGGGQIGDSGSLTNDQEQIHIFDTKKENNLIVHLTAELPKDPTATFKAQVNAQKQADTAKNHSATHLLHHALRTVLGTHVEQKGSLVTEKGLRFDFSHFSKVTDQELEQIEAQINAAIQANLALEENRALDIEAAKAKGAMALFGEKYGDKVRVIQFGASVELCGGIHVHNTGQIGVVKIVAESAVAAGIRRIEAITGTAAMTYFREKAAQLEQIDALLKKPKDLVKAIEELQHKNSGLQKELERFAKLQAQQLKDELNTEVVAHQNMHVLFKELNTDAATAKDILFQLRQDFPNFVGVIGHKEADKCGITIILNEALASAKNWQANQWIKEISGHIQGGGGGQAAFATAGGKNPSGLATALAYLKSKLG
jgi:alanyl-tRNA synthetase